MGIDRTFANIEKMKIKINIIKKKSSRILCDHRELSEMNEWVSQTDVFNKKERKKERKEKSINKSIIQIRRDIFNNLGFYWKICPRELYFFLFYFSFSSVSCLRDTEFLPPTPSLFSDLAGQTCSASCGMTHCHNSSVSQKQKQS